MLLPEDSYNIAMMTVPTTTTGEFVTRIDPMGGQSLTVPHSTLISKSVVIIGWAIIENHPVHSHHGVVLLSDFRDFLTSRHSRRACG
jgi:hypothetical protein